MRTMLSAAAAAAATTSTSDTEDAIYLLKLSITVYTVVTNTIRLRFDGRSTT